MLQSPLRNSARGADYLTPADLCHPTLWRRPFTADGWLFELKHDGFRAFVRKWGSEVNLLSRWGRSMAHAFPDVIDTLLAFPADVVLDAELVVADEQGRSDFEELRRRALLQRPRLIDIAARHTPATLVVFDVLSANGEDVRGLPLRERKQWLQVNITPLSHVRALEYVPTYGEALFDVITDHDCEGIVAKRVDAPHRAGRQPTWRKIKNQRYSRQEALRWRG